MDTNTQLHDWISVIEACHILNRGASWLGFNWSKYGLERKQIGRNYLYRRDQIEELAKNIRGPV